MLSWPFPPPVFISNYILIKKWREMISWFPSLLQCSFVITFLIENDWQCSLGSHPSLSISCYIPIQKWREMLSWLPSLLQCSFVITFLFQNEEKCSPGALPSSSDRFLLHFYWKMMRNALLASFPPAVFVSYYILIKNWWEMLSWLPCPIHI